MVDETELKEFVKRDLLIHFGKLKEHVDRRSMIHFPVLKEGTSKKLIVRTLSAWRVRVFKRKPDLVAAFKEEAEQSMKLT
jgi:hypothetical protein